MSPRSTCLELALVFPYLFKAVGVNLDNASLALANIAGLNVQIVLSTKIYLVDAEKPEQYYYSFMYLWYLDPFFSSSKET